MRETGYILKGKQQDRQILVNGKTFSGEECTTHRNINQSGKGKYGSLEIQQAIKNLETLVKGLTRKKRS